MKLDIDTTPLATQQAASIYINGKLQNNVVKSVDDETGIAKVFCNTANGQRAVIGFGNNRRYVTRLITKADIRIVIPAGVPFGPYETPIKPIKD